MSDEQLLNALDEDIIQRFKSAVELGKWPDGKALTETQKQTCMQAIIFYEHKHLPEDQRTGYVPPKESPCETKEQNEVSPIKWK